MLELKNISKVYKSKKRKSQALNDISVSFGESGLVCVVGESGSGKTTLLNILGLLDSPTCGELFLDGTNVNELSEKKKDEFRSNKLGFIFQDLNLVESYTVRQNLQLVSEHDDIETSHGELIELLGIGELLDKLPKEISGGQRQRVAIARALIKGSKILLCDEPTGSLDPTNARKIFETLKEISKQKLVVVVSHDVDTASKYADRIIEIENGKIVSDKLTGEEREKDRELRQEGEKEHKAVVSKRRKAKQLFGIAARYAKLKPVRFAFMSVTALLIFVMLSLLTAIASYNENSLIARTMHSQGADYFSVTKQVYGVYDETEYGVSGYIGHIKMTELEAEQLEKDFGTEADRVYTYHKGDLKSVSYDNNSHPSVPGFYSTTIQGSVELTNEFIDKYGYTLYGRLPQETNEAVLSEYAFRLFKFGGYMPDGYDKETIPINTRDDLIGKEIRVDENSDYKSFTVVGILDTNLDYERYDFMGERLDDELKFRYSEFESVYEISPHAVLYVAENYIERLELDKNSIAHVFIKPASTVKGIKKQLAVGNLKMRDNLPPPNADNETNEYCFYKLRNEIVYGVKAVNAVFETVAKVVGIAAVVFAVILVLLILNYFSGVISDRIKDVGVLRTNGFSKWQICLLFIFEALILSAFIVVASIIFSAIVLSVGGHVFKSFFDLLFFPVSFSILQPLIIIGLQVAFSTLGILIPLIRLMRKKPVEIINAGKQ